MIQVYNKQTSFVIIGNKHIAPFKTETFPSRNAIIRSLERNGIVKVTEVAPINSNPVSPELFDYEIKKNVETVKIDKEIKEEEKPEETTNENDVVEMNEVDIPEQTEEQETEQVAEETVETDKEVKEEVKEDEAKPKRKRRNTKKKGE